MANRFNIAVLFLISGFAIENTTSFLTNPTFNLQTPVKSTSTKRLSQFFMSESDADNEKKRIVVIGNGMVGQRFMENLIDLDSEKKCTVATFCEEKRAAYNRVKLTSYFETRNPSDLSMTDEYGPDGKTAWFDENDVEIFLNDKAVAMDTEAKTITGESGRVIDYDVAVLATGSFRKCFIHLKMLEAKMCSNFFSLSLFQSICSTNPWKATTWCFRIQNH